MSTTHLTSADRQALRDLFDQADLRELLLAVAGIIRHDVKDFEIADAAGSLINRAANLVAGKE